jgi:lysozyme
MDRRKAIAAACVVSCGLTASYEGLRTHPYADPRDGRPTVCFGDTQVQMKVYTPQECQLLLRDRQAKDYAPVILKCVPALADNRFAFAASIDAAYNGGPSAFCRSTMAAKFNRRDWIGGCNAFRDWHTLPGTNVHRGLVRRRQAESELCLRGAS